MPTPSASEPLTATGDPRADDVARFERDFRALSVGWHAAPLIVAVSGGPDSMALVLLAHAALGERCRAVTVDHGLRPEAADEARLVAAFCAARAIPHMILRGNMPDRRDGTANLSTRARGLRYDLLGQRAAQIGATAIATAHHADDQLETIVMRLNRGSGVAGLAGIRVEEPGLGPVPIVRPLLGWRRAELARIRADCDAPAVADPSNTDDRFDRARLRKALAHADWLDPAAVAASGRWLGDADQALDWAADDLAARYCSFEDGKATLMAWPLPAELRRRLVGRCIRHINPEAHPRGSALAQVGAALDEETATTLADVLCDIEWLPLPGQGRMPVWRFRPAPLRRTT